MDIHVYMLRCVDGSFYVGLTRAGLDKRIGEHHAGTYGGYTSYRRPVTLVWSQEFQRLTDAIVCERSAYSSCTARETSKASARCSAVMPMRIST